MYKTLGHLKYNTLDYFTGRCCPRLPLGGRVRRAMAGRRDEERGSARACQRERERERERLCQRELPGDGSRRRASG